MSRRTEILAAVELAARVRQNFPLGSRTSFDVLAPFEHLGIPVLFRRLKKLWGACITVSENVTGVLVTTALDLPIQRFTLAHELGHVLLKHGNQVDQSVGFVPRNAPSSRPIEEQAADTFASELLGARPLLLREARKHAWTKAALGDPENIYQLGLRLGLSYQASCWALFNQGVLSWDLASELQNQPLKGVKHDLAPVELLPSPWSNVWRLGAADSGSYLEAGPEDLFLLRLTEDASAGFLWDLADGPAEVQILREERHLSERYGSGSQRSLWIRFGTPGVHRLQFLHKRPWEDEAVQTIEVAIENYGKETGGQPRRWREEALAMGAA